MESSFISLIVLPLIVCDRFGNVPIFVSALRAASGERRRRVIRRASKTLVADPR